MCVIEVRPRDRSVGVIGDEGISIWWDTVRLVAGLVHATGAVCIHVLGDGLFPYRRKRDCRTGRGEV